MARCDVTTWVDRKCEMCDATDATWTCLNCKKVICDKCKSQHLQSEATEKHKVKSTINEKILNSFIVHGDINRVTAADDGKAWVWGCTSMQSRGLKLVTSEGQIEKCIMTRFLIHDVIVGEFGELLLLLTVFMRTKVVKCSMNGEGFQDVYVASEGYTLRAIALTDSGNVVVGLKSYRFGRKLVEITRSGKEVRSIQDDPVFPKLVVDPVSICTNRNGDIVVVDCSEDVIAIDLSSKQRFRYYGTMKRFETTVALECVVTDKYGHIIISDSFNNALHLLNKEGLFLQYLLNKPYEVRGSFATFVFPKKHKCFHPKGLTIEKSGILWVYCHGNEIKRVQYL